MATNSKYKAGSWRVVIDAHGIQRLALPDGTPIARIDKTVITQTADHAMRGSCSVVFDVWNANDRTAWPTHAIVGTVPTGIDTLFTVECIAYPDPTETAGAGGSE